MSHGCKGSCIYAGFLLLVLFLTVLVSNLFATGTPYEEKGVFPIFDVHQGTASISYLLTHREHSNELVLHRKLGFNTEGYWDYGTVIDTVTTLSYLVASSPVSDHVYIVYADDRAGLAEGEGGYYDLDIYYRTSSDQGLTWDPRICITNYTVDSMSRAGDELSAVVTPDDILNVIWNARILTDSITYDPTQCRLFYWNEMSVAPGMIAEARYELQPPCLATYSGFLINGISLAECDSRMYALWNQYGATDCSQKGYPNGDLFLSVSDNLGFTWDSAQNVTMTPSPDCDSGTCYSEGWSSMIEYGIEAGAVDSLEIIYIGDRDAGCSALGQGSVTENPVMRLRLPCREVVMVPRLTYEPRDFLYSLYTEPGVQLDTQIVIRNYGTASSHWSISIFEETGSGWICISPGTGALAPGPMMSQSIDLSLNCGGALIWEDTYWDAYLVLSSAESPARDTIPIRLHIGLPPEPCDSCDIPETAVCDCTPADANGDDIINVGDAVYLINYVFKSGLSPVPYDVCSGDANGDCIVNVGDAVYLINFVFKSGLVPVDCEAWVAGCGSLPVQIHENTPDVPLPGDKSAVAAAHELASPSTFPGECIGFTGFEGQHFGPMGRQIAYDPLYGRTHYVWTWQDIYTPETRDIKYQLYGPTGLMFPTGGISVSYSDYACYANCDYWSAGYAAVGGQQMTPDSTYYPVSFGEIISGMGIFVSNPAPADSAAAESPKIQILDKDMNDTDVLSVAKWQGAFNAGTPPTVKNNFIDNDPDRFYVKVTDGASAGKGQITVTLETKSKEDKYNDPSTVIMKEASPGVYTSKSLMLMSDDVDDDYKVDGIADDNEGDRTHKVLPEAKVIATYNRDDGTKHTKEAKVPANLKTVKVNIVILNVGRAGCISTNDVKAVWQIVKERYAQLDMTVSWTITNKDQPAGVDLSDGLMVRPEKDSHRVDDEAKAVITALGTAGNTDDIHIFYVNDLYAGTQALYGTALAPGYYNDAADAGLLNNVFMDNSGTGKPFNAAHELAHLLGDIGHHADNWNVLYKHTSTSNTVVATKRFDETQETKIRSHDNVE